MMSVSAPTSCMVCLTRSRRSSRFTTYLLEQVAHDSQEFVQQCLRILHIRRIEPFGEPGVDRREEVTSLWYFPLLLPQASEARRGAEFPGFRLLVLGYRHGLPETGFGFTLVV